MTYRMVVLFAVACTSLAPLAAQTPPGPPKQKPAMKTSDDLRAAAPALDRYATTTLAGLWKRPGLSPRDRSLVTVPALIARQHTAEMAFHMTLALDNGGKPGELSETITYLASYSGWGNADGRSRGMTCQNTAVAFKNRVCPRPRAVRIGTRVCCIPP